MQSSIDEYDEVSEQMSELSDTDSILENTEDCEESETASAVEESPESREISTRSVRKVYLITYRQADLERFPIREAFANTVWRLLTLPRVECLMFCIGYAVKKPIFQVSLKLSHPRRWLRVRHYFDEKPGISVNFSGNHSNY